MEEEIQQKNNELKTREAREPPGLRVPPAPPTVHATPSADERPNGPKTEERRTKMEQQARLEDRTFSSGDKFARGEVIEPPETMGDNGGVKLENTFVPSADGSSLDEEANKQPTTKGMIKAAEGPPTGGGIHVKQG